MLIYREKERMYFLIMSEKFIMPIKKNLSFKNAAIEEIR